MCSERYIVFLLKYSVFAKTQFLYGCIQIIYVDTSYVILITIFFCRLIGTIACTLY